ncbi:MAG: type II secretion system GspH family protein [Planctomycetota bacterium]|nr:type II secretion system GspH family protein [Planctomycetota bacterium]
MVRVICGRRWQVPKREDKRRVRVGGKRSAAHLLAAATAFTLVELLVVMAIISLLAALLMPVLSKARAQAQGALCMGNQKQMLSAIGLYHGDTEGHYPVMATNGEQTNSLEDGFFSPENAVNTAANNLFPFLLTSYVGGHPLFRSRVAFLADIGGISARPAVIYFCPADKANITGKVSSYAGLYTMQAIGHAPGSKKWQQLCLPSRHFDQVKKPRSQVILFGECSGTWWPWNTVNSQTLGNPNGFNGDPIGSVWDFRRTLGTLANYAHWDPSAALRKYAWTHPGGLNFAYMDFHVSRSVNPPYALWSSTAFLFNNSAPTPFDSKGLTPLER